MAKAAIAYGSAKRRNAAAPPWNSSSHSQNSSNASLNLFIFLPFSFSLRFYPAAVVLAFANTGPPLTLRQSVQAELLDFSYLWFFPAPFTRQRQRGADVFDLLC
jgi:hypothetical protein